VETYRQVHGIDAKIARVFTTYGPHMKLFTGQLVPDFIINALEGKDLIIYGDENFTTALCYVTDMVDGLARLMAADPKIKVVNLGNDQLVKLVDIANMVIEMTNSSSKIIFEDEMIFITRKGAPDLSYVKESLGWMPLVTLKDGLAKTVDYTIANKEALLFDN